MKVEGAESTDGKDSGADTTKKLSWKEQLALKKAHQLTEQSLSASTNLSSSVVLPSSSLAASVMVDTQAREKAEQAQKQVEKLTQELDGKEKELRRLMLAEDNQNKIVQQREKEIQELYRKFDDAMKTIQENEKKIIKLEEEARLAASIASSTSGSVTPPTSPKHSSTSSALPLTPSKASLASAQRFKQDNDDLRLKISGLEADILKAENLLSDAQEEIGKLQEAVKLAAEDAQEAAKKAKDQYDLDGLELDKRKVRIEELEKQLSTASSSAASSKDVSEAQRLQAEAETKLKKAEQDRDQVALELADAKKEVKRLGEDAVNKDMLTTQQIKDLDEKVRLAGEEVKRLTTKLDLANERADNLDLEVQKQAALLATAQKSLSEADEAKRKELDALREEQRLATEKAQLTFEDQFKKEEERVTKSVMLKVNADFAQRVSEEVASQVKAAVEKREREVIEQHRKLLAEAKAEGVREAEAQAKQQIIDAKAEGVRETEAQFKLREQQLRAKLTVDFVDLISPLTLLITANKPANRTDTLALLDGDIAGSKGAAIHVDLSDFLQELAGQTVDLGELLDPTK